MAEINVDDWEFRYVERGLTLQGCHWLFDQQEKIANVDRENARRLYRAKCWPQIDEETIHEYDSYTNEQTTGSEAGGVRDTESDAVDFLQSHGLFDVQPFVEAGRGFFEV